MEQRTLLRNFWIKADEDCKTKQTFEKLQEKLVRLQDEVAAFDHRLRKRTNEIKFIQIKFIRHK